MGYSDGESNSPVLKHRLMSSCLLTPFRRNNHHLPLSSQDRHNNNNNNKHHRHASFARSSSRSWGGGAGSKSPVHQNDSDMAAMGKEKCMQFISRMGCAGGDGGGGGGRHRRRHSVVGDFHYDALSYSLNFDDGNFDYDVGLDSPSRDFSSRLPQSPPPAPAGRRNREMQSSF
ncbi:hypothetical protein LINGRAHAP2_LOCUS21221 [Linum grandiflorum]